MAKYVLLFAGNILNVSITRSWYHTVGQGHLSTMLINNNIVNWATSLGFYWQVPDCFSGRCFRESARAWSSFSLVWAFIIAFPTFLINRPYIHYILEPVAAIAVLLAISLDHYVSPERKKILRYWLIVLVLIGLNGIGHNQEC